MNNKKVILATIGIVLAWGGWLIYRNNRNNKIDKTVVPFDEAKKRLENL
jgi:hypothetical protein